MELAMLIASIFSLVIAILICSSLSMNKILSNIIDFRYKLKNKLNEAIKNIKNNPDYNLDNLLKEIDTESYNLFRNIVDNITYTLVILIFIFAIVLMLILVNAKV